MLDVCAHPSGGDDRSQGSAARASEQPSKMDWEFLALQVCSHNLVNATEPHYWKVNIGSGDGLLP